MQPKTVTSLYKCRVQQTNQTKGANNMKWYRIKLYAKSPTEHGKIIAQTESFKKALNICLSYGLASAYIEEFARESKGDTMTEIYLSKDIEKLLSEK